MPYEVLFSFQYRIQSRTLYCIYLSCLLSSFNLEYAFHISLSHDTDNFKSFRHFRIIQYLLLWWNVLHVEFAWCFFPVRVSLCVPRWDTTWESLCSSQDITSEGIQCLLSSSQLLHKLWFGIILYLWKYFKDGTQRSHTLSSQN